MENCTYVQRTFLSLEDSNLEELTKDDVRMYPNLKMLDLRKNKISRLDINVFEYNDNLSDIDLSYNKLSFISKYWFRKLISLHSLNLSNNLITLIDVYSFPISLRELKLRKNEIDKIRQKAFHCMPLLEYLDLSENALILKNTETFEENLYLKKLNLSRNKILNFPFDTRENNINIFRNLTFLNLLDNDIVFVRESTFTAMPNIQILKLKVIGCFTFRSLNVLNNLQKFRIDFQGPKEISFGSDFKGEPFLRNSNLKKFAVTAKCIDISEQIKFQKLVNLESLYFESQYETKKDLGLFNFTKQINGLNCLRKLSLISCKRFKILPKYQEDFNGERILNLNLSGLRNKHLINVFKNFPCLKELNLSDSKLEQLNSKLFKYQTKLETLVLSGTRIRVIAPAHFANCILLNKLDLSNCEIEIIRNFTFEKLTNLTVLSLQGNPFRNIEEHALVGLEPSVLKSIEQDIPTRRCSIT